MVIYLCKGYVIFSFLKSRWSEDQKSFFSCRQEVAYKGNMLIAGMDGDLLKFARQRLWDEE